MLTPSSKYTAKLTASVTFPLVILFNILFLANEFSLLLLSTSVLLLNFSYIVFSYQTRLAKVNGGFRMLLFFAIMLSFGLSFTFLFPNLNYYIFTSFKIGWLIGFFVVVYLSTQFLLGEAEEGKLWQFEKYESRTGQTLIKCWTLFIFLFLLLYLLLVPFFLKYIGSFILLLNALICFLALVISGLNYGIKLKFEEEVKNKEIRFLLGGGFLFFTFVLFNYSNSHLYAFLFLIIGFTLVLSVVILPNSFKRYLLFVCLPSLVINVLLFFFPTNIFEIDIYLAPDRNGRSANELILKKNRIESHLKKLYGELADGVPLSKYVRPQFDINIINRPSIWRAPELNLELKYSYELIELASTEEVPYFKPNSYTLESGNVAYAMAQAFKISLEDCLNDYFQLDRKVEVILIGTADTVSIIKEQIYNGIFDRFYRYESPVINSIEGNFPFKLKKGAIITSNIELAALRALSLKIFINEEIEILRNKAKTKYHYWAIEDKKNTTEDFKKVEIILKMQDVVVLRDLR